MQISIQHLRVCIDTRQHCPYWLIFETLKRNQAHVATHRKKCMSCQLASFPVPLNERFVVNLALQERIPGHHHLNQPIISSFHELMQSRGVRRPSVLLSVNFFAQIATTTTEVAGSLPNLHTMVPRRARIQGVLKVKVKVKGHVIRALL